MRRINKIIAIVMSILCLVSTQIIAAVADTHSEFQPYNGVDIFKSVEYLGATQDNDGCWSGLGNNPSAQIANSIELVATNSAEISDYNNGCVNEILNQCIEYYWNNYYVNVDMLSNYLLITELQEDDCVVSLLLSQNPDGGFGLAENYASDIIGTKLALKALADLGETEAMTKAALYIASLQNEDGGFSYQLGLASNPELTAEIADIFGDCIIKDQSLGKH